MTRRDAIAKIVGVLLAKLVLIRQSKILLLHMRLGVLRQQHLMIRLRLRLHKLAHLLLGDLHLLSDGGVFLVTPLPADREILPADHLRESLVAVATDIIEFRLERGDLGVTWILLNPECWGENEG